MRIIFILFSFFCSCNSNTNIDSKNKETSPSVNSKSDAINTPIFISGNYHDVALAYDSINKTVTGVYQYYENWDENFKEYRDINIFYFFGLNIHLPSIIIKGAWPNTDQQLNGTLYSFNNNDTNRIKINLDNQPLGYNDVDFTSREGVVMNMDESKKWIEIRIVKSSSARLFNQADSSSIRKGFLVKNDIVKVLSKHTNGWYNIEYNPKNDNKKSNIFWIREESLYNLDPSKW